MYRILLADDEGIMLESLKKIIESEYGNECEIHCAKSGRVVVEMAQAYPPDICFMDIQMPGISGIQAIKEIKKFNSSAVFVIITAYDKFNYAKEALSLGVQEFLTKPVNKKLFSSFLYSSGSSTRISASSFSALISPDSLPKHSISTTPRLSNRETPPIAKASALAVETDTGISSTRSAPHRRAISARACLEMRAGVPRCT